MNAMETMKKLQRIPIKTQRHLLILTSCLLTLSVILWLIYGLTKYSILFSDLELSDANQVIKRLDEKGIDYKIQQNGAKILVDKKRVDKLRIELMGQGMPLQGGIGFEIFDRTDFGMTEFSQKINYQRALQGELERTITSLKEVKSARVHLVIPQQRLFESHIPPKASITLHLNAHAKIKRSQVKAIQALVSASVAELSSKNIIIIDDKGNTLTQVDEEGLNAHFAMKQSIEKYLSTKVNRLLASVFRQQTVMVNIDVTLETTQTERQSEQYLPINPEKKSFGVITHMKEVKHSKGEKKAQLNDITSEKSFQYGRLVEKNHSGRGSIKRLTVSVVLPTKTSVQKRLNIESLVKSAIGFDSHRGDTISVAALSADSTESILAPVPILPRPHSSSPYLPLLCLLALIGLGISLTCQYVINKRRQNILNELSTWLKAHDTSI